MPRKPKEAPAPVETKRTKKTEAKESPTKASKTSDRDNSLMQKALGMSTSLTATIAEQDDYIKKDFFQDTGFPGLNLILSGNALNGGLSYGVTLIAGPSKHAKTILGLLALAKWQKDHPKGIAFLYNNEFGINEQYLINCGVDLSRVLHIPFSTIEDAKVDIAQRLDGVMNDKGKTDGGFEIGDEVFWFMDSIGRASSKAEADKAQQGKNTADMGSRAKAIHSFFRVVTPKFNIKKMHFVVIGSSLDTLEEYSKRILSGGGGGMLAADNVLMMFRTEVNDTDKAVLSFARGKENLGYRFVIFSDKSRFVKEKKTIPFDMYWDGGPVRWGGFDELGMMLGVIEGVNRGNLGKQYKFDPTKFGNEGEPVFCPANDKIDKETGEVLEVGIDRNDEFWKIVFEKSDFEARLAKYYKG